MTTPNKLLTILAQSRATTAALANSARVPFLVAEAMLQRHEKDGLVRQVPHDVMDLWELTETGKAAAQALS